MKNTIVCYGHKHWDNDENRNEVVLPWFVLKLYQLTTRHEMADRVTWTCVLAVNWGSIN